MKKDAKRLEKTHWRDDVAQTFKILKGIDKVNSENLFQLAEVGRRTKGNSRTYESVEKACTDWAKEE
jgi:hypothetical protein